MSPCEAVTKPSMELSVWCFLGSWLFMKLLLSRHSFWVECWNKQYIRLGVLQNVWCGVVLRYVDLVLFSTIWYFFNERLYQEQWENCFSNVCCFFFNSPKFHLGKSWADGREAEILSAYFLQHTLPVPLPIHHIQNSSNVVLLLSRGARNVQASVASQCKKTWVGRKTLVLSKSNL